MRKKSSGRQIYLSGSRKKSQDAKKKFRKPDFLFEKFRIQLKNGIF